MGPVVHCPLFCPVIVDEACNGMRKALGYFLLINLKEIDCLLSFKGSNQMALAFLSSEVKK